MTTATFVYMLIEAVVFILPIAALFTKLGRYAERMEKLEKRVEKMDTIDSRLTAIETKLDLILENKVNLKNDNNTGTSR